MEESIYNFMKMRLWNDLNNILILDTCAARNFFEKIESYIKKNRKNRKSIIHYIYKGNIKLINIESFRETFSSKKEGIVNIFNLLKEFIKLDEFILRKNCNSTKKCISKKEWNDLKVLYRRILKKYKKTNDHWIILKIMISFPKKNLFLLTEDLEFINFLKKCQEFNDFRKINKLIICNVSNKNLKNQNNWYNKKVDEII